MEKKQLRNIPIGSIVQHLKGTKTYEVLEGFRLKKTDNGVEYNSGSLIEFYIIKENNMKIYKENDEVKFVIGTETFTGIVMTRHVSMYSNPNHIVFDKLGIKSEDRNAFCSKYYGCETTSGAWPICKSNDKEALSRLIHALQELCDKHNGKAVQEPKVGDWVKCISNDYAYAKNYIIGKKYQILEIDLGDSTQNYLVKAEHGNQTTQLNYHGKCFILCDYECIEPIQDDSEWKEGDQLQYVREADYKYGLNDCTVGNIYTIIRRTLDLNHPIIIDDVDDEVSLIKEERDCFKKIINNQTTQLNYHGKQQSCNGSEGIELCTTSISISTGQTYRGEGVSDSRVQIYI